MVHRVQGRSQERGISEARAEVLLAETPLPPPLPRGAIRHPQPGKSPLQSAAVFSMQIGCRAGGQRYPSIPGEAVGWEGCEPLPGWAMHWSPLAWPLCRCHSNRCGRIGAWRCCPQDLAHRLMGQGQGTSSGWLGCRERNRVKAK